MSIDFYESSILPHAAIIVKICRAYTDTDEDFEDYYQEVCLQIWRTKDGFGHKSKWSTWIYRIALNVCLTLLRKKKRRPERFDGDLPQTETTGNMAFEDESLKVLYKAIRQLPEIDRAIILLYLEEKSYKEIAGIMGTNANSVGVRITRIKERLKKLIDEKIN